jgi:hypothetical protein
MAGGDLMLIARQPITVLISSSRHAPPTRSPATQDHYSKGYIADRDAVTALKRAGDAEGARKMLDENYTPASQKFQDALQRLAMQAQQLSDTVQRFRMPA